MNKPTTHYTVLQFVYVVFIAVLTSLFICLSIETIYVRPKQPDYPITAPEKVYDPAVVPVTTEEAAMVREDRLMQQKRDAEYQTKWKAYEVVNKKYSRNASIIAMIASLLVLVGSLILSTRIMLLADGFLLGSVFILMYSIFQGFQAGENYFRLAIVGISLCISIFIGYYKFVMKGKLT